MNIKGIRQMIILHKYVLSVFLVLLSVLTAASQEPTPGPLNVGECTLTLEVDDKWDTMRLRPHHPEYKDCNIDKGSMVSALSTAFSRPGPIKRGGGFSSLSLGRLINYPWISQYLATTACHDPLWDSKKGRPRGMDINKYVSRLLFQKELLAEIETAVEKGGYHIAGVTVEKVLVGGFREVPFYKGKALSGRLPFDAQVWLRLGKNPGSGPTLTPAEDDYVGYAKSLPAEKFDKSLPSIPIEKWIASSLPPGTIAVWGASVTDCGEQTGDPAVDRGRDMPLCAEIELKEHEETVGYLLLFVGTEEKGGLKDEAGLYYGYIKQGDKKTDLKKLQDITKLAGR